MQIAPASPAHALDLQLVISARLVQRDVDPKFEPFTRFRNKSDRLRPAPKHNGPHCCAFVLDRKIPMTRCGLGKVGYFPPNPNSRKLAFQQLPYLAVKLAYCPNAFSGNFPNT